MSAGCQLALEIGAKVIILERLRFADDEPLALNVFTCPMHGLPVYWRWIWPPVALRDP
jgi:DNA-binding GntR family transcriptional regulator